ncbi:type IV pilus secretin PilQ [Pasteurella multocida]
MWRAFRKLSFVYFLCGVAYVGSSQAQDAEHFYLRLKQAPLVEMLQYLALRQHQDLLIDDHLEGTLSLQMKKTTFEKCLQSIAKMKQLEFHQEGKSYYLTSSSGVAANDTHHPTSLMTSSIKLHFAKAADVVKSLTSGQGSLLSVGGSLSFDERTNLLLIQDEPQSIQRIKALVAEMDKPIEQIAIEARIVTMTDESLQELGVRWGLFQATEQAHTIAGSLAANGFSNIENQLNVNFTTNSAPVGSIALQLAKINGRLLDLELTALEREKHIEIIASPRLLTTNKKSASIKQGTEIPYVMKRGKDKSESVEFREAVLGLDVTPHISKDNTILLDLLITQNTLGAPVVYDKGEIVSIDKQEINTQVVAQDGETIVLGGVFHDTMTKGVNKVPLLGDLPLLKHVFSQKTERHQKRELVIFVTPHIIKPTQSSPEQKTTRVKKSAKSR